MRFGKRTNIVDAKKTRSCVVRLQKVSQTSPSPPPSTTRSTTGRTTSGIRGTAKHTTNSTEDKNNKTTKTVVKRSIGSSGTESKSHTPIKQPDQKQRKPSTNTMPAIRSNQKLKIIPKAGRITTPRGSVATPVRDETPPPTLATGRSRRAIKPNPKYASEDIVTPKILRNVGVTKATTAANESSSKQRRASTSSEDFFNNNSDDDYEETPKRNSSKNNDFDNDKAYKIDLRDEAIDLDSDISDIEEELPMRVTKMRGRPRKSDAASPPQPSSTKTTSVKRNAHPALLPVRTAPTQLQQLRRSLASANAQRNQRLLSGTGGMAQKRKLDDSLDSDDSDNSYTVARKKMMVSSAVANRVRIPVKESDIIISSAGGSSQGSFNRNKFSGAQKVGSSITPSHSVNGKPLKNPIIEKRKMMDPAKKTIDLTAKTPTKSTTISVSTRDNSTHHTLPVRVNKAQISGGAKKSTTMPTSITSNKSSATGANDDFMESRLRTINKESSSNSANKSVKSSQATSFTPLQQQKRTFHTLASKTFTSNTSNTSSSTSFTPSKPMNSNPPLNSSEKTSPKAKSTPLIRGKASPLPTAVGNNESLNSTMDDFETMPTFTIVNVNDIINKKGDVMITKSETPPNSDNAEPTVIEFSESICLDDDEYDDDKFFHDNTIGKEKNNKTKPSPSSATNKFSTASSSRLEVKKYKPSTTARRDSEQLKKKTGSSEKSLPVAKPEILNHKLGLRNSQLVTAKITASQPAVSEKPAPRILNSVVAKRTQPVKPMIANLDDSTEEYFPLSLDEEEESEDEATENNSITNSATADYSFDLDIYDTESQNTEPDENNSATNITSPQSTSTRIQSANSIEIVSNNVKGILTPATAKENSLAANNDITTKSSSLSPVTRKSPAEKVLITQQGDQMIQKITCFETWYVINLPLEAKREAVIRNQLDMPLIQLANNAKTINLPSDLWTFKVTLYEIPAVTLAKSTLATYTGDLTEYNISEEDRAKYQPSCVMFRRTIENRQISRMPYDRAVIFKNKTFSTNIEGKNIRLAGAPSVIISEEEIEILLEVVDTLTLTSDLVENFTHQK